jgi:hypothetical protein
MYTTSRKYSITNLNSKIFKQSLFFINNCNAIVKYLALLHYFCTAEKTVM